MRKRNVLATNTSTYGGIGSTYQSQLDNEYGGINPLSSTLFPASTGYGSYGGGGGTYSGSSGSYSGSSSTNTSFYPQVVTVPTGSFTLPKKPIRRPITTASSETTLEPLNTNVGGSGANELVDDSGSVNQGSANQGSANQGSTGSASNSKKYLLPIAIIGAIVIGYFSIKKVLKG
jgi:hypothetical protein